MPWPTGRKRSAESVEEMMVSRQATREEVDAIMAERVEAMVVGEKLDRAIIRAAAKAQLACAQWQARKRASRGADKGSQGEFSQPSADDILTAHGITELRLYAKYEKAVRRLANAMGMPSPAAVEAERRKESA